MKEMKFGGKVKPNEEEMSQWIRLSVQKKILQAIICWKDNRHNYRVMSNKIKINLLLACTKFLRKWSLV